MEGVAEEGVLGQLPLGRGGAGGGGGGGQAWADLMDL